MSGQPGAAGQSVASSSGKMSDAQRSIEEFWPAVMNETVRLKHVEPGNQLLPLARIKKIMKLDEDVKMISAEAPLLFAKAAELFIQELTLRAWLHTEENKRRTLQRSDIAMAIAKYDQFDFLIDIVPREEIKPSRRDYEAKSSTDDVQYYLQLAQQHQQALQDSSSSSSNSGTTATVANPTNSTTNVIQMQTTSPAVAQVKLQQPQVQTVQQTTPQIATITAPTQNIILTNPGTGQATIQTAGTTAINAAQLAQGQPLQLMQQVLTPTGEVTHIPIPLTQTQLNFIRSQIQLGGTAAGNPTAQPTGQPIIIQAPQIQTTPTIIQTSPAGVFLNAAQLQQLQQQQQQQHQQQHLTIQQSPVHQHQPQHQQQQSQYE
ncbi:nuclear transcription factor Y subunit gamma [Malaya genurostris]|uniref:nuclear transcription factor Y subunit gamma n=1 Tax=Malaya genurostris TaxID=325434 RepID=UPI0026F3B4D0|nr:nuclear transcription factor Y subunit gamma [Malaya genurostris]XP_058444360.1 nuclear transcription factor Y subunit gamma [Malaya genurostris]